MEYAVLLVLISLLAAYDEQNSKSPVLSDLQYRWTHAIPVRGDSKASHIGKTTNTRSTSTKLLSGHHTIALGDDINGLHFGAIKYSFFNKDASYAGEQYMW